MWSHTPRPAARSLGRSAIALAMFIAGPGRALAVAEFDFGPIADPILSASFAVDTAALVAHRTVAGHEVNFVKLVDPGGAFAPLDLSTALFGNAAWPAPALVAQGATQTGWISAAVSPAFFPVLAGGHVGIHALFTDTSDAKFAIDTLVLTIQTSSQTIVDYYGAPVGNENDGFGMGLPDGGSLSSALPAGIPGGTGTGFDEVISSKLIPEPATLLLFGIVMASVTFHTRARRLRRVVRCISLGIVVVFGFWGAPQALALTVVPTSPDAALARADMVVVGTVMSKSARWAAPNEAMIATDYTFHLDQIIFDPRILFGAKKAGDSVVLTFAGGTIDGKTVWVPDIPEFAVGEQAVLIIDADELQSLSPLVGVDAGLYRVAAGPGGRLVLSGAEGQRVTRGFFSDHQDKPAGFTLGEFVDDIRRALPIAQSRDDLRSSPMVNPPSSKRDDARSASQVPVLTSMFVPAQGDGVAPQQDPWAGFDSLPSLAHRSFNDAGGQVQFGPDGGLRYDRERRPPDVPSVFNVPPSLGDRGVRFQFSMSDWNRYAGDVFRVYPASDNSFGHQGRNDHAYTDAVTYMAVYGFAMGANTLAVTVMYNWRGDGAFPGAKIYESDIIFNNAVVWTTDWATAYNGGGASYFVRSTAIHELGHAFGRGHQFDENRSADWNSVMNYPPAGALDTEFWQPFMDDAESIRAAYPARVAAITDLGVHLFHTAGTGAPGNVPVLWSTFPLDVAAGSSFTLADFVIENLGTGAQAPMVDWYLTPDQQSFTGGFYCSTSVFGALGRFQWLQGTRDIDVPAAVPPGLYYIAADLPADNHDQNRSAWSNTQIRVVALGDAACCVDDDCSLMSVADCGIIHGDFHAGFDCAHRGACCFPADRSCREMAAPCCIGQGGQFHEGDTCQLGACCVPDGTCRELAEPCCDELHGTFHGGTDCVTPGACCADDGSCLEVEDACECDMLGGTFRAGADCVATGACCLPDGTCQEIAAVCCEALLGRYHVGHDCVTPGACCLDDDTCLEVGDVCECDALDGQFHGGTDCINTGSCCLENGECIETSEACCLGHPGASFHLGADCQNLGSCCYIDGHHVGECIETTEECCNDLPDTHFHLGADCQNTGACCFGNGRCLDATQACCGDLHGTFYADAACGPRGACCLPDDSCVFTVEVCCVDDLGGVFYGDANCVPGACCFDDGTCEQLARPCCENAGGEFHADMNCDIAACCYGDGTCEELAQPCCEDQGGRFYGNDDCVQVACCLPDENWVCDYLAEACCRDQNGFPFPFGDCTVGACCFDDDTCEELAQPCCEQRGGHFYGNTDCIQGACCLPDETCAYLAEPCCMDQGGTWYADGDCTVGGCCFDDYTCEELARPCCEQRGGSFYDDADCTLGACCFDNGNCVELGEACCKKAGGTFSEGEECGPIGSCCLRTSECIITYEPCCEDQGGIFHENDDCASPGACCMPNGTCHETPTVCCDEAGGHSLGPGTHCGAVSECCLPDGTCAMLSEACCTYRHGTYHENAACEVTGSCCLPNGTCVEGMRVCCDEAGGTFTQGASCEPRGACCLPNNACVDDTSYPCCQAQHGLFLANGVHCADFTCQPDQLHLQGPDPNVIAIGNGGLITATLELQFNPLPGRELVFSKVSDPLLVGAYAFTAGAVSPDGMQSSMLTDAGGQAAMTFTALGPGFGMIEVSVAGTDMSTYAMFQIVPAFGLSGDVDGDGDVDLVDYGRFQRCFAGVTRTPVPAGCESCDLDEDGSLTLADYAALQAALAGPQ